jgi:hypothetical protein
MDNRYDEIARRLAAAYISCEVGMSPATVYRSMKSEEVGEPWFRVAQLIESAFQGATEMPEMAVRESRRAPHFHRECSTRAVQARRRR